MLHLAYNLLWAAAQPLGHAYLVASSRNAPLRARLRPEVPNFPHPPLWIHACSVGEVALARTLAIALQHDLPGQSLLFTTSTPTGMEQAQRQLAPLGGVAWCPFDAPGVVRRFMQTVRPRMLVLIETEVWPNLQREAERAGVPVVLVNGRLSEKHFHRYRQAAGLFAPAFARLTVAAMQDETTRDRILTLGARLDHICITGNMKFDAVTTTVDAGTRSRLRAQHGIPAEAPIVIFGSTRPGDEAIAAACWKELREEFLALHIIIAPRHLDRIDEALAPFAEAVLRRSKVSTGALPSGQRVHCIDTHGELVNFYATASVAVVGGSFSEVVQGHNPLEPAALGIPTLFGMHMKNFAEPASALLGAQGAIQVAGAGDLLPHLRRLLHDPAERRHMGTRARKAVLDRQGATQRNVRIIKELL